jgi:hypothetical protein
MANVSEIGKVVYWRIYVLQAEHEAGAKNSEHKICGPRRDTIWHSRHVTASAGAAICDRISVINLVPPRRGRRRIENSSGDSASETVYSQLDLFVKAHQDQVSSTAWETRQQVLW